MKWTEFSLVCDCVRLNIVGCFGINNVHVYTLNTLELCATECYSVLRSKAKNVISILRMEKKLIQCTPSPHSECNALGVSVESYPRWDSRLSSVSLTLILMYLLHKWIIFKLTRVTYLIFKISLRRRISWCLCLWVCVLCLR